MIVKLLHKERGGIRTRKKNSRIWWRAGMFLAKIEIYKNKVVLAYPSRKIVFKRQEIKYVENFDSPAWPGVRIAHRKAKVRHMIVFCSKSNDRLLKKFMEKYKSPYGIVVTRDKLELRGRIILIPLWLFLIMC